LQRLTNARGYDAEGSYSPDGEWIVWRRFDEEGLTAEIWVARPDGSAAHQVTRFEAMIWAPYIHPSGEYIMFTTNKQGFANFERNMVDFAGEHQPVRVTYTDGFDGLPVPTPDGSGLTWTTNRHGS